MFEIILHYFIFLLIIFSNGLIFQNIFLKQDIINSNFFELTIIGLITTGFIAHLLNFIIPLNNLTIYLNLIVGSFFIFFFKNKIKFNYHKKTKLFIILIFILSLLNLYGSGFSDDLNHYHGGSITNTDNHNYIIGLNFLHHHYGYSSIWLTLHSYLNFNFSFLQDIHILNAIIFFLIISYFITEIISKFNNSKNYLAYPLLSIFIFFFLIKYTRLKEFGLDRPGILIYCFLVYFALKYKNILITTNFKKKYLYFFIIFLTCLFITSIKIFFLSCFLIPLFLIYSSKSYNFFFTKIACVFYFLLITYFLKNILITGCLIYPFEFTCLTNLQWNSKEIASNLLLATEASTKSFDQYKGIMNNSEYIDNFKWFGTWFSRNVQELTNYIVTITFVLVFLLVSSKLKRNKKKITSFEIIIFLLFIVNLIFFLKSPVIRYHHMLFVCLALALVIITKKLFIKKIIIFNIILLLCISFNYIKNTVRIYKSNFYNDPYEHIKKIEWYRFPVEKKIGNFKYYNGWIDKHPIGNMTLDEYKHKKKFGFDIIYKE